MSDILRAHRKILRNVTVWLICRRRLTLTAWIWAGQHVATSAPIPWAQPVMSSQQAAPAAPRNAPPAENRGANAQSSTSGDAGRYHQGKAMERSYTARFPVADMNVPLPDGQWSFIGSTKIDQEGLVGMGYVLMRVVNQNVEGVVRILAADSMRRPATGLRRRKDASSASSTTYSPSMKAVRIMAVSRFGAFIIISPEIGFKLPSSKGGCRRSTDGGRLRNE